MKVKFSKYVLLLLPLFLPLSGDSLAAQADCRSLIRAERDGKFGMLDDEVREAIPFEYDWLGAFNEGWAAAQRGTQWVYLDTRGEVMLDLGDRYTWCGTFHEGKAVVTTQSVSLDDSKQYWKIPADSLRFIDRSGRELFTLDSKAMRLDRPLAQSLRFSGDRLLVHHRPLEDHPDWEKQLSYLLCGYVDTLGRMSVPAMFHHTGYPVQHFSEGRAGATLQNLSRYDTDPVKAGFGFIDTSGAWVIPPRFHSIQSFRYGAALVQDDREPKLPSRYYLIDDQGEHLFPPEVETASKYLRDSLVAVYRDSRTEWNTWDFQNMRAAIARTDGTYVTDFTFTHLRPGKTATDWWSAATGEYGQPVGFVDDTGNWTIPPRFARCVRPFEHGLAVVEMLEPMGQHAVIRLDGSFVLPPSERARYFLYGGVILRDFGVAPDDPHGYDYFNRRGELLDFSGYRLWGQYRCL